MINFDFPLDTESYIHRVGRTARGDNAGTALSFVSVAEMKKLDAIEKALADSHGTNVRLKYISALFDACIV